MAKPSKTQAPIQGATPAPPEPKPKLTTIHSYRTERLSMYEYQGYRLTKNPDGTFSEEPFGRPSLFNLVMRRVFEALNKESGEVFQANKTAAALEEAAKKSIQK